MNSFPVCSFKLFWSCSKKVSLDTLKLPPFLAMFLSLVILGREHLVIFSTNNPKTRPITVPADTKNIANMADTVVTTHIPASANFRKMERHASICIVLIATSSHLSTNLLKHYSPRKCNSLKTLQAPKRKIRPPNVISQAILCHKAARPYTAFFALK